MILVSPSEPAEFLDLIPDAVRSTLPERFGADFLAVRNGLTAGVQRKTPQDIVASLEDGRLVEEINRLKRLDAPVLLLEGEGFAPARSRYTGEQVLRLIFSVQAEGVWFLTSPGIEATAAAVTELVGWLAKGRHLSIKTRPKTVDRDGWGRATDRDWAVFLLQGFPGIGPVLAEAIYDRFGRVPLAWTCSEEELREIDGIGPKRAKDLIRCLEEA